MDYVIVNFDPVNGNLGPVNGNLGVFEKLAVIMGKLHFFKQQIAVFPIKCLVIFFFYKRSAQEQSIIMSHAGTLEVISLPNAKFQIFQRGTLILPS